MSLMLRLELLHKSGQIDDEVQQALHRVMALFQQRWNITLSETNGRMMVTHLAIALMRIKRSEVVTSVDEATFAEIEAHQFFAPAQQMLAEIEKILPLPLPEGEQKLMLINNVIILEHDADGK